jgi:hypothetical protein
MYVLASKNGILTGRRLAKKLGLKFQTDINRLTSKNEIAIRYGNAQLPLNVSNDTDCNSREAIIKASAKHMLSKYLEDTDIVSPKYFPYTMGMEIPEEVGKRFLSRNKQHRAGKDIVVLRRGNRIPLGTQYLVPLYENIIREYRVHVAFGNVVKVMRKYPIDEKADPVIKTASFGWQYKRSALERVQCSKAMIETALKAAEVLGLQFCGIDMAWSGKEKGLGKWIIWEMNSAPSLNTDSLNLYANLFTENLQERLNEIRKPDSNNGRGKPSN